MRYLVFYKTALLRHFDAMFLELANRGNELVLASPHGNVGAKIPGDLLRHENVRVIPWRVKRKDGRQFPLSIARRTRDYLRYLDPKLEVAYANRERAWRKLAGAVTGDSRAEVPPAPWIDLTDFERRVLDAALSEIEDMAPPDPATTAAIQREAPDVVLVTPLVSLGSKQTDIVAACKALGIPSALLVFSWDNLSNKGLIHVHPDAVFVWNELQKREATELHGVPEERVIVTGAPRFDEFYAMSPSRDRDRFLSQNGLVPGEQTILYLGSAPFVSRREPEFVATWLTALRSSEDERLRNANVFIRPHPRTKGDWIDFVPEREWGNAVVELHPSIYRLEGLHDQIAHADVVVGLNTSGQLEAAILGKPVYTVDAGEYAPGQEGSSHYYYLLREHGGFVEHAHTLEEHLEQLAAGLRGEYDSEAITSFATSFLRPQGVDLPATEILVNEIEAFAKRALKGKAKEKAAAGEAPAVPEEVVPRRPQEKPGVAQLDYPRVKVRIKAANEAERLQTSDVLFRQPWTVTWLEENVREGDVAYDVGATVGVLALIAARLVDHATVIAFEPGAWNYTRLCENIHLNGAEGSILPLPVLLASDTGLHTYAYESMEAGRAQSRAVSPGWGNGSRPKGSRLVQGMAGLRLDDAVKTFDLPQPSIVHIAGASAAAVLQGGRKTLRRRAVRTMLVETPEEDAEAIGAAAARLGFRLKATYGEGNGAGPRYSEFERS